MRHQSDVPSSKGRQQSLLLPPIPVVDDENFDSDPAAYPMTVHLLGATSSPGCANFALKTTANQYESVCGKEAADFVSKDF